MRLRGWTHRGWGGVRFSTLASRGGPHCRSRSSVTTLFGQMWRRGAGEVAGGKGKLRLSTLISSSSSSSGSSGSRSSIPTMLGHASFALVALSYSTTDDFLLRTIAVSGSTMMLFFSYYHPHGRPLWLPFGWNVVLIGINLFQVTAKVMKEREAKEACRIESYVYKNFFPDFSEVDFAKLCALSEEEYLAPGQTLFEQGDLNDCVFLVVKVSTDACLARAHYWL